MSNETGENFIAELRQLCQKRQCRHFYNCHKLLSAGSNTDFSAVQHCQNTEIAKLCKDYFNSKMHLHSDNQINNDILQARASQELYNAAMIPQEGTERIVFLNEPSPAQASKIYGWWGEILSKFAESQTQRNIEAKELVDSFAAQFEPKSAQWEASFQFQGSHLTAVLIPDFERANKNNFIMHPETKQGILKALNSGKIFLKDSHSKKIADVIGKITKGYETQDGKIVCEADLEDERISKILKKSKDSVGVSLAGSGDGFCSKCGAEVTIMGGCNSHKNSPIVVKNFQLKEVSLVSDPAFPESRILDYKE